MRPLSGDAAGQRRLGGDILLSPHPPPPADSVGSADSVAPFCGDAAGQRRPPGSAERRLGMGMVLLALLLLLVARPTAQPPPTTTTPSTTDTSASSSSGSSSSSASAAAAGGPSAGATPGSSSVGTARGLSGRGPYGRFNICYNYPGSWGCSVCTTELHNRESGRQERHYSTLEQAEAGHALYLATPEAAQRLLEEGRLAASRRPPPGPPSR